MKLDNYLTEALSLKEQAENVMNSDEGKKFSKMQKRWFINNIDKIASLCKPYLADMKRAKLDKWAYRGSINDIPPGGYLETVRKDRMPKNTAIGISKSVDRVTEKMFGFKSRSEGLFMTGNPSMASTYGKVYIAIPAGKYKYIWSRHVQDSYDQFANYDYFSYFNVHSDEKDIRKLWSLENDNVKMKYWKQVEDLANTEDQAIDFWMQREMYYAVQNLITPIGDRDKFLAELMDKISAKMLKDEFMYKSKDLKGAIYSGSEIIVSCDKYFFIDMGFEDILAALLLY